MFVVFEKDEMSNSLVWLSQTQCNNFSETSS